MASKLKVNEVILTSPDGNTEKTLSISNNGTLTVPPIVMPIIIPLSDETTALTTGTAKSTIRMPFACKLASELPRISVNTASSSGLVTVDINKSGTSIFSTLLTLDANEKTSKSAATPCVLTNTPTSFTDDEELTIDIDVAGAGAKGLKLTLYVVQV